MRTAETLAAFTRDALAGGAGREEIRAALIEAGWSAGEADRALAAWSDQPFRLPVPRPQSFVSARDAFLYGLMFVALTMTAWHLVTLLFTLIDLWIPDVGETYTRYDAQGARWSIAMLAVFFPLFVLLDRREARGLARDPARRRSAIRKAFVYIALFVSALTLAGDLVYAIYSLLNGDLTLRFALKLATIAVTAGGILAYFVPEVAEARDAD